MCRTKLSCKADDTKHEKKRRTPMNAHYLRLRRLGGRTRRRWYAGAEKCGQRGQAGTARVELRGTINKQMRKNLKTSSTCNDIGATLATIQRNTARSTRRDFSTQMMTYPKNTMSWASIRKQIILTFLQKSCIPVLAKKHMINLLHAYNISIP